MKFKESLPDIEVNLVIKEKGKEDVHCDFIFPRYTATESFIKRVFTSLFRKYIDEKKPDNEIFE